MDEVLVDVVKLKFLEGEFECFLCVLNVCSTDLGGYIKLLSWDASFFDCLAEFGLVAIDYRRIQLCRGELGWRRIEPSAPSR